MKSKPFISVVIPTHNRLTMLKQLLTCLEKQTYPRNNYEIIIIDDGSNDGTESYLNQLAVQGKLRYFRQTQQGPATARNTGAKMAQGEIIAYTDDDCLPETNWLMALAESYTSAQNPSDVIVVNGRIKNVSEGHWLHLFHTTEQRHQIDRFSMPNVDTANVSFRRSTLLELGGFDENFPYPAAEDIDIGIRFVAAGYKLHTNSEAVVWHVGSTSLRKMTRRSFELGFGFGILLVQHPNLLFGASQQGLRFQIKRVLIKLVPLAYYTPRLVRPFFCAWAAVLRRIIFITPEAISFSCIYFPRQISRYIALNLNPFYIFLYLLLEWHDYFLKIFGQLVGMFKETYNRTQSGQIVR